MREIKFRGWKDGKLVVPDEVVIYLGVGWQENPSFDCKNIKIQCKLDSVDEYTGLKDKNGVEIYEGDIVLAWFPSMPTNMRCKQEVMFHNGSFGCGSYMLGIMDKSGIEVIGNIHENPELLEG